MEKKFFIAVGLWLFLFVTLFPGKVAELPELNKPSWLMVNSNEIFILDDYQVAVYSLKDYKFLRKFGKKGEGPGELLPLPDTPLSMDVTNDRVILNAFNKVIFFSKAGKFLEEKRFKDYTFRVMSAGKGYVATIFSRGKDGKSAIAIVLLDEQMNKKKTIYENSPQNDTGKGKVVMPMIKIFTRRIGEKLYVFDQQKGFLIKVFDLQGTPLNEIKIAYDPIKTDDVFKKKWTDWLCSLPLFKKATQQQKDMLVFSEYLPVIRTCVTKDNRLYLQTYRTKGDQSEFYFLDPAGKVLAKTFLPGADVEQLRGNPATIYDFSVTGSKYYYLHDNPDEETIELHVLDVKTK